MFAGIYIAVQLVFSRTNLTSDPDGSHTNQAYLKSLRTYRLGDTFVKAVHWKPRPGGLRLRHPGWLNISLTY